jgi:hypothetical protein
MSDPIEPAKSYFQKTSENRYGKLTDEPIPDFARLFHDQVLVQHSEKSISYNIVRNYHVGDLNLPSGKLVACDPGTYPDPHETTFNQTFKPGQYSVYITVVHMALYGGRVALARVQFSEMNPVHWKVGMDNSWGGFGTDMAHGSFMDAELAESIQKQLKADEERDEWYATSQQITDRLHQYHKNFPASWASNIVYDEATGANIIAFSTGIGDGNYPCYCGYDEKGQLVCALADFWIHDVETASDWSTTGFPPIPNHFDDSFLEWVEAMIPHLKQPTIHFQPFKPEEAAFLFNGNMENLPGDIALYYAHITPWMNVDDPQNLWQTALEHIYSDEQGNVIPLQLKPSATFLPLNISNLDSFDVAILDEGRYMLATIRTKPPETWRSYRIIEADFYQCDLKTYILKRILAGLETNAQ